MTKNSISKAKKTSKNLWSYYSSLEEALQDLYPEYPWDPSQFAKKRFRPERDSLLQLLRTAEEQLGINQVKHNILIPPSNKRLSSLIHTVLQPSDWYSITTTSISAVNNKLKLWRYYSSLEEALRYLYPGYSWDPLKLTQKLFRHEKNSLLQLLINAEQQLGIKQVTEISSSPPQRLSSLIHTVLQPSDWYSITLADLKNIGAPSNLCKAELAEALQERYPDFKWEKVFLLKGRGGQQRRLQHVLTELFPVK